MKNTKDHRKRIRKEKIKRRTLNTADLYLSATHRWFFGQGLQVVSPLEDAKQQAVIAVFQQPADARIPQGATLTSRSKFSPMALDLSLDSLHKNK